MESLVDLLPLLFIGLYYLLSNRRKAAAKQAARQHVEAPQAELVSEEASDPTPFQTFLQQLEEAMAESAGGLPTENAPVPTEEPTLPPRPVPEFQGQEFHAVPGSFDSASAVDHERHGFGDDNPLSEEAFERQPAFAPLQRSDSREYDPHGLRRKSSPRTTLSDWRARLRDPRAARDAFVLQTIFGARGGIHGSSQKRGH